MGHVEGRHIEDTSLVSLGNLYIQSGPLRIQVLDVN